MKSNSESSTTANGKKPNFPFEIHFVDCEPSPYVQEAITEQLSKLEHHYRRIVRAEVMLRIPHRHSHHRFFHVHIRLDLPGEHLVVNREPELRSEHTNINGAIHDAFAKLTRQLESFTKKRQSQALRANDLEVRRNSAL